MTAAHKTSTLAKPAKAFEIDTSWYQSYWYDWSQPEPQKPSYRFVQALVLAIVFVAGTYFAL
jgi:hypothetical protein